MNVPGYRDHPTEEWDPVAPVDAREAEDFLRQCYLENPRLGREPEPVAGQVCHAFVTSPPTGFIPPAWSVRSA